MSLLSPQLEAFIAICKYKTVHAAAESLHITQTAVTQRIQTLEAKLHTTLFIRSRRGMELTAEGKALLQYCHAAKELEGQAYAKIKGVSSASNIEICISGPSSIMHSRIIPSCYAVAKKFTNLLLKFDINDNESRHLALKAGNCQFAIVQPEHIAAEMKSQSLKPERYVLVCPKAWGKRKLEEIISNERIIDFNENDTITFNYLKQYGLFHYARHDRHFVNKTETLALMIMDGFGFGALTDEFAEPYLQKGQLILLNQGKTYDNPLSLVWFDRPEPPSYFKALIKAIK